MANTGAPPNYYKILEIAETATTQQVRDAYKKAALKTHPDRVPADSPERATRTRKFQLVNDAYYTLSDTQRRREYDAQRRMFGPSAGTTYGDFSEDDEDSAEEVPPQQAGGGGGNAQSAYSWAWNFFTGGKQNEEQREKAGNQQFGDVFEEMLREEGMAEEGSNRPTGSFWGAIGGLSGGALGFIMGNMPGAVAGAVAGNRLGSVRDARGKSVYAVFQELPQPDRARLLTQLAAKIFSHTVGV